MTNARCIVPMTGFFEWLPTSDSFDPSDDPANKPYFLSIGDSQLHVAGLAAGNSFALVVRSGTCSRGHQHRSIPTVLTPISREVWLTADALDSNAKRLGVVDFVEEQARSLDSGLRCFLVDPRLVNQPTNKTDPRIVEPFSPGPREEWGDR